MEVPPELFSRFLCIHAVPSPTNIFENTYPNEVVELFEHAKRPGPANTPLNAFRHRFQPDILVLEVGVRYGLSECHGHAVARRRGKHRFQLETFLNAEEITDRLTSEFRQRC